MKHLIVNADDFGISPGTNRAIVAAFERGVLTSASLMVNMPSTDDAVRLSRACPGLRIGLHACLTCGPAALPRDRVPLLVDARGHFRHSFVGLWRLLRSRRRIEALAQIEAEIAAQWLAGRRRGAVLTHVDSHQHVHMLPGLFAILASLARDAGVPMRVSREPLRLAALHVDARRVTTGATGLLKAALLAGLARGARAGARPPARSDVCLGIIHSGRMTAPVLQHLLRSLPDGVVELITHPSLPGPREADDSLSAEDRRFLHAPFRGLEYEALVDPRLRDLLDESGIVLRRPGGADGMRGGRVA